jgi:hypothetical protein
VDHLSGRQRHRAAVVVQRHRRGDRPRAAGPLLHRAVGHQVGGQLARPLGHRPRRRPGAVGDADRGRAALNEQAPHRALDHDVDRRQAGQGEQQVGGEILQRRRDDRDGAVAQRQDDLGGEPLRGDAGGRPRQPQHRHGAVPAGHLPGEARDGGHLGPRPLGAEPHPTGRRQHHRLVTHRQDRGEADAEAPDGRGLVALGGRAQRGEALDAAGVQW